LIGKLTCPSLRPDDKNPKGFFPTLHGLLEIPDNDGSDAKEDKELDSCENEHDQPADVLDIKEEEQSHEDSDGDCSAAENCPTVPYQAHLERSLVSTKIGKTANEEDEEQRDQEKVGKDINFAVEDKIIPDPEREKKGDNRHYYIEQKDCSAEVIAAVVHVPLSLSCSMCDFKVSIYILILFVRLFLILSQKYPGSIICAPECAFPDLHRLMGISSAEPGI
jgi:hypothetical protein